MLRNTYKRMSKIDKYDEWSLEFNASFQNILNHPFKFNEGDKFYKEKIRKFLYCELLMYTAYKVYEDKFAMEQLLVLFSGVHRQFINVSEEKEKLIVQANIFLNSFISNEWEKRNVIIHFYFKQRYKETKNIQMFIASKNIGKDKIATIAFNKNIYGFLERIKIYDRLLSDNSTINLIEATKENGIINNYLGVRIKEKKDNHKENKIKESLENITEEFVKDMDNKLKAPYYWENYRLLSLTSLIKDKPKDYTHIVGKTGHGKSILMDIYINKLFSDGYKVLYVSDNHNPNSFNTKIRLDKLGIKTNIIMGKYRDEHLNSFISKYEDKSIPELIIEYSDIFHNLDYTCLGEDGKKNHCKACKQSECGFFNMYRRISNSDVIITTPYNLLDTITNSKVDKYRRTIYEILSLWADVIIWDEVDKLQIIGDDREIRKLQAYSLETVDESRNTHLEMFLNLLNKEVPRKRLEDLDTRLFKNIIRNYDNEADFFQNLFLRSDGQNLLRKLFGSKNFNIMQLIEEFTSKYISSVKRIDGNKPIDIEKFNNRMYSILNFNIKEIRQKFIRPLVEEYMENDEEFTENEVYETLYENIRKFISAYTFSEEYLEQLNEQDEELEVNVVKINFKQCDDAEKVTRNIFLGTITMLISIENYLKHIYSEGQSFLETLDNAHDYIAMSPNTKNHIMAPLPLIQNSSGFSLKIDNLKETRLIYNSYLSIGREILFNNCDYVSLVYDIPKPYNIYTSATSTGTTSSRYNFKLPADTLLKRKNTDESRINVICHMFYKDDKPIKISGENLDLIKFNMGNLTKCIISDLIKPNLLEKQNGILIVTSSYKNSKIILDELLASGINAKAIYNDDMGKYDPEIHIKKIDIEKRANECDVLVGITLILERGLNMLDENEKSYFQDIIIMNRNLPTPDDLLEEVSYLHQELYMNDTSYTEVKANMYKTSKYLRYLKGYKNASTKVRSAIGGNSFVTMKQLVGRGQRGGTDVTLHLVDSAFYPETAEKGIVESVNNIIDTSKTSLFMEWLEIVNADDEVINYLYDDIKNGLNDYQVIVHK